MSEKPTYSGIGDDISPNDTVVICGECGSRRVVNKKAMAARKSNLCKRCVVKKRGSNKMVDNRSYKIWLVVEIIGDRSTPVAARTLKSEAEKLSDRLRCDKEAENIKTHPDALLRALNNVTRYEVMQIDLVTHDGAHTINMSLIAAVGKNG